MQKKGNLIWKKWSRLQAGVSGMFIMNRQKRLMKALKKEFRSN